MESHFFLCRTDVCCYGDAHFVSLSRSLAVATFQKHRPTNGWCTVVVVVVVVVFNARHLHDAPHFSVYRYKTL